MDRDPLIEFEADDIGAEAAADELVADPESPVRPRGAPAVAAAPLAQAGLWLSAGGCAAAALLSAVSLGIGGPGWVVTLALAALALAAALATRLPRPRQGLALTAVAVAITVVLAGASIGLGWGLAAPGLPVVGLLVCLLCAAAGWRSGALLAGVAVLAVLAVGLRVDSLLPSLHAPPPVGGGLELGAHLIAIAAGLIGGVMVSQLMTRSLGAASEREQRFRSLLALAADAYWETDIHYRLVAAARHQNGEPVPCEADALGRPPWELAPFECDPDTLDELLADLDTRVPFRERPVRWTHGDGRRRDYLVSGEPRFNERGVFTGYWGVARDVTEVQAARQAAQATQTRYQDLFSRIPTPLVMHRAGRVIDANPPAVALFGFVDLPTMIGSDLLAAYESGGSRERARRRIETLMGQPLGAALPVADFRLEAGGRVVSVRATSVRVDADDGPAMLAIYIDDTERLAAEQAVRRSETMLSHLVATSPDLITLTDMATGRYAMVNRSFERMSGWTAAEAVGRTSLELGVWRDAEARQRFVDELRRTGSVADLPTTFITRSGDEVSMVVSAAQFVMDRRAYMVINARDVTEKERERLQREAILANASIGIAVTRDRRFVLANPHFEQIYGWQPGELLGQPGSVVWRGAEDYAEVSALAGPLLARGEAADLERAGRRKDGSTFLVRARGRAIDPAKPAGSSTVWIVEDVTERREFERTLARARDDAEAASRAKSAFLANTSHELRTPLNGLIGLAQELRDHELDADTRRRYLDLLAESAQSLSTTISDILDLSKIEAGKLLIEHSGFQLGDTLRALLRLFAQQAESRGLALHAEIAADADTAVLGDRLRVRQIVGNFLSNALKFTHAGQVSLRAHRLPLDGSGRVRIVVQDTGVGIDAGTRERLFQPFMQADQSTTRRYGGTGLGLSICHELATIMGGAVGVDSEPGVGSSFWVELPLTPTDVPDPPSPRADAGSLEGAHVLMVEDNPVNMEVAVSMLQRWGVRVARAHDGLEALAAVTRAAERGEPFDVVLMDVQMPVMSGHEASRALRDMAAGRTVPIIALTAAALVSERDEAIRSGMNDFLTKPIDQDKLRAALTHWRAVAQAAESAS